MKSTPLTFALLVASCAGPTSNQQPTVSAAPQEPVSIACSPETPLVEVGASIVLHASAPRSGTQHDFKAFAWAGDSGKWFKRGSQTSWTPDTPGLQQLSVTYQNHLQRSSCKVLVRVVGRVTGLNARTEAGSGLLEAGKKEQAGYGLYSYLLMPKPTVPTSRQRQAEAVSAFVKFPTAYSLEEHGVSLTNINITYLPVRRLPPGEFTDDDAKVAWIMREYDYDRAQALLRHFPTNHKDGPFFVSLAQPLGTALKSDERYLWQDLTSAPPEVVRFWVREFLNQSQQDRFWERRFGPDLALRLRTAIAVAVSALPSLSISISWQ